MLCVKFKSLWCMPLKIYCLKKSIYCCRWVPFWVRICIIYAKKMCLLNNWCIVIIMLNIVGFWEWLIYFKIIWLEVSYLNVCGNVGPIKYCMSYVYINIYVRVSECFMILVSRIGLWIALNPTKTTFNVMRMQSAWLSCNRCLLVRGIWHDSIIRLNAQWCHI